MDETEAFAGAMAKLARAQEHFAEYEVERDMYLEREPYGVDFKYDHASGWHVSRFRVLEEPPPILSVLLGEIAYATLSALNHLTWELAERKLGKRQLGKVKRDIQFPVCRTPNHFANSPLARKRLVGRKSLRAIERLQPYDGRLGLRRGSSHPLALTKAIADADKHRLLVGRFAQIRFTPMRLEWNESVTGRGEYTQRGPGTLPPLLDGVELTRVKFLEGNSKAKVRAAGSPEVDLLLSTDRGAVRHRHIGAIPWWLQDVALMGMSWLFDQDEYMEPPSGWRSWWKLAAETKHGLAKPHDHIDGRDPRE